MPKHWPFLSKHASKDARAPDPTSERENFNPKFATLTIEKFIPQKPRATWGAKDAFGSLDRCAGISEGILCVFLSYSIFVSNIQM